MDEPGTVCWPEIHSRQNKEKCMWEAMSSVNKRR